VTVTQRTDDASYADLSASALAEPAIDRPEGEPAGIAVEPDETTLDVPPMWKRLAARVIDVVAVATWVFALAIAHIFLHLPLWSGTVAPEPWGTWFLTVITFAVCYAAYEIVFVAKTGATPGKDYMGLAVVDATTGAHPTYGQAARRWFLPGIVQPIPGAWVSGVLTLVWGATALVDDERRAVHDRLAGTRVVTKVPPATEEEREHRRKQFRPRFIDPFAVYRAARNSDVKALKQHPSDD
jgi:uncharacterized RDD family membrane protein YckC